MGARVGRSVPFARTATFASSGLVLLLSDCEGALELLARFGRGVAPPPEVMELLPLPANSVIGDAEGAGTPAQQDFTCVSGRVLETAVVLDC